jgi:sigma-B regulation protein RsbU (phosphoserine phosphatase)
MGTTAGIHENRADHEQVIRELYLLQRVAQRIASTLDLDVLLEDIVTDVAQTFGYSRSGVLLKDDASGELVIAAVRGWTVNYHRKGDRFKIGEYGMVGHVGATGETYYAPDVRADPYYQVSEEQTRSEVDIPLTIHGRLIGVLNAQHTEVDAFPPERIRLLEALAGHVASAIENARLFQRERAERERMQKELGEARRIQHALFPARSPLLPGTRVEGRCLPCLEVGGDWYDYLPLPDGRLAVMLGDVSGKGLGAALLMSSTRTVLRLVAGSGLSPGEVLSRVNEILLTDLPAARFVTMVYAVVDPARRSVVLANAGHPHPLLAHAGTVRPIVTEEGLPLGIREGTYSERVVALAPGDRLLLYSDGVTEAMNSLSEQYGEPRLFAQMIGPVSIDSILEDVQRFAGGRKATDDVTVVVLEDGHPAA